MLSLIAAALLPTGALAPETPTQDGWTDLAELACERAVADGARGLSVVVMQGGELVMETMAQKVQASSCLA